MTPIKDIMYVITWKSGLAIWKEQWYVITSRISLQTNLYMTHEDQVFIINLTWEMVAINVISRPTNVITKLSTIAKFHKYRGLHEGHHFIPMAMEVHSVFGCDMDCFIRTCVRLFHDRQSQAHLSLSFFIQFFKQCVNIALTRDTCFTSPISIKSCNLHAANIRRAVGEITSYHKKD